jgi:2-C-methyl-D-erythritol 4-phosphate cytidylyltransferase
MPMNIDRNDVSALILAAGDGLRMGLGSKAFLQTLGRTRLEHALDAVLPHAGENNVGVRAGDFDRARVLVGARCLLLPGGATRQETVSLLLQRATRRLVLLHEVARPFVTAELFQRVLAAAGQHGAASLYRPIPVKDSCAIMQDHQVRQILPRAQVVTMQTPHAYQREILLDAHHQAAANAWQEDGTAAIVQRAGYTVQLVLGTEENTKLTYPADAQRLHPEARAV